MKTLELKAGSPSGSSWKSPVQKLAKFFERSRDRWKAKYFAKKEQYKLMGNQARNGPIRTAPLNWNTRIFRYG